MQNLHYKHVFAWILVTIIHLTFLFSLTLIVNTPKPKHELKFEFVDVNGMYEKDDNAENLNTESIKNDNKYVSQPVIKENKSLPKKTEKKTKRTPPKKILSTEKKKSQFKTVEKKHKAKSIEKETSKKNNNNDIVTDPIPNNIASNNTVTEAKTDN
ncbi:MAG: hypothetical protein N4Q30_02935, partial [Neisseriaceae bacterium]|nr:hypothetical protein [Neisseriaceae bacterium]